ncbi:MAG: primosomal protein N' [Candidatus Zixiibacteriota bacterium]|nr:MAG: primosomal protein N' [candidate division Zixibacteria bacterium]
MDISNRLVTVAVSGPICRTFTYHLSEEPGLISPGQRVLVEFGRSRKVGFYVGRSKPRSDIATKPVDRFLDNVSYFPRDLFETCLWVSQYYFANPADCLAAALPPLLKSRRSARLRWTGELPESYDERLKDIFRPDRRLSKQEVEGLRRMKGCNLVDLVKSGVVTEEWPEVSSVGRMTVVGYVAKRQTEWSSFFSRRRFKPDVFDSQLSRSELEKRGWSTYYIRQAVSAGLLQPVTVETNERVLDFVAPRQGVKDLKLTLGQQAALDDLRKGLNSGFNCSLLHGITGSGKTLIYCHLAREVLERDKSVLVLTPEIALSGATLAYFRGFFGDLVTVVHSAMTVRERMESWRGIRSGKYRVVVGPRSAVFSPVENLGLVIVDEEHDGSYKQDDPAPRFHGRDTAIMRAKIAGAPVVLGTASPSLESYYHARSGRYRLVELMERPTGARLPAVRVMDMRTEKLSGDHPYLSFALKKEIDLHLEADQQVILFLNRRGYSPQLKCADCGHVPTCPHCDLKLTYHRSGRKLSCHYCGHICRANDTCDKCAGRRLLYPGAGTQKVEEQMALLLKRGRVLRFDSDTASGRINGHRLLQQFAEGKYNVLLGTQMVTKGLDLSGVSLVGVLSADMGLDMPDFRASEKTFARLLQVAGRSGRGEKPGEVIIQTYYPDNEVIRDAANQDYVSFFEREIESRREHGFPPFARLVRFVLSSKDEAKLEDQATQFANQLRDVATGSRIRLDLIGPAPCPMQLLRGRFRRQLFARTTQPIRFVKALIDWENRQARFGLPSSFRIAVDVDPIDLM